MKIYRVSVGEFMLPTYNGDCKVTQKNRLSGLFLEKLLGEQLLYVAVEGIMQHASTHLASHGT